MDQESTAFMLGNQPRLARCFFIIGTLGIFSGLLAISNAFAERRPVDPAIGLGEVLVGALLACIACRARRDFVWLLKVLVFESAILVALSGVVRIVRLVLGSPGSMVSSQALLPLALTVLGGLGIQLAYRFLHAGEGIHSSF